MKKVILLRVLSITSFCFLFLSFIILQGWNNLFFISHFVIFIFSTIFFFLLTKKLPFSYFLSSFSSIKNKANYVNLFFLILIIISINVSANLYNYRFDTTQSNVYSLNKETKKIVKDLDSKLKIFQINRPDSNPEKLSVLLNRYKELNPNFVKLEQIHPFKDPHIIQSMNISPTTLARLTLDNRALDIQEINEGTLTSAIYRLLNKRSTTVSFITGNGESLVSDKSDEGLSSLAAVLESNNFVVLSSDISKFSKDTDILVWVEPKNAISKEDGLKLQNYTKGGGKILILHNPDFQLEESDGVNSMKQFSSQFGINFSKGVVLEKSVGSNEISWQVSGAKFHNHSLTKGLNPGNIYFLFANSLHYTKSIEGATFSPLVLSSTSSWLENDLEGLFAESPTASFDKSQDQQGPLTIGASLEFDSVSGVKARIVAFGDSEWVKNANINLAEHRSLILRSFEWLEFNKMPITISPKILKPSYVPITNNQYYLLMSICFIIPELILILGLFVVYNRRSRSLVNV